MTKPIIGIIICEIRYPAAVMFFDRRGSIVSKFKQGEFVHWNVSNNQIEVLMEGRQGVAFAAHNRAGLKMELPPNPGYFLQHLNHFTDILVDEIGPTSLSRIGLRMMQWVSADSFEEMLTLFDERVLKPTRTDWGTIGEVTDYGIAIDSTIDANMVHFRVGPMLKAQLRQSFESEQASSNLPDYCYFCDFDFFREGPGFGSNLKRDIREYTRIASDEIVSRVEQTFKLLRILT